MSESEGIDPLEREVIDHVFEFSPGYAVALGLHQYDGRLPDFSREATERWAARARTLLARLTALAPASLEGGRRIDRFLLQLLLESPLFDIEVASELDRNPMVYVGNVTLTPYITRAYAPPPIRIDAAVRVLRTVPQLLDQGRRRLTHPLPRPFVDLAITMGEGLPSHFEEAEQFAGRAGRGPEMAAARATAESAVGAFVAWLRDEARGRAVPEFALGAERFQRLLFVREGVSVPFSEIRRAGLSDLERNQKRLEAIARAEQVPVAALFERMNRDHPSADALLATARAFVEEAREFVRSKDLVTIPEPTACRVEETPVWGRALTTASMDSPGAFETGSSEGIYYVTPVDRSWTAQQQDEWLRSLNRAVLRNVTIHEVFPGHYLQFLTFRAKPGSLTRKVFISAAFTEGWAHYVEQLAIESGLDPGNPIAEVAQIHDALLRNCRLVAAIGLHTEGWSLERATELFQTAGHFDRLPAEREALRGTYDPGYFCYTLGKLAILDARHHLLDAKFGGRLHAFHDATLSFGAPPIGLLDELLRAA